ncbi:MAG: hypothetical protein ACI9T7_001922 [Oleiphilaceae bacterium]|jgi:hypothetical protein
MLDPFVAQIIQADNFDHFTTSDVRAAFLTLKTDPDLDRSDVRRMIYAELMKLVKKGHLKKIISKHKGQTKFRKTTIFNLDDFQIKPMKVAPNKIPETDSSHRKLTSKLNFYKTELLQNLGESEAYKDVYQDMPELISEIQPKYDIARDNATKLLGKIKAIEEMIKQRTI